MALGNVLGPYAALLSAFVAAGALVRVIYEYIQSNRFHRFEKFQEMSIRFDENTAIQQISECLLAESESKSLELESIDQQRKEVFICFIEEVAFMQNSGYISPHIAGYTFGQYASLALDSDAFWKNLDKKNYYYSVFVRFCRECQQFKTLRSTGDNWNIRI